MYPTRSAKSNTGLNVTGTPPIYRLHGKTSFVSTRPHLALVNQGPRTSLSSPPDIRSLTRSGLETSSWSSSRSLDWPTPQRYWISPCKPLEARLAILRDHGHGGARHNGPSWLRDDDDDDVRLSVHLSGIQCMSVRDRVTLVDHDHIDRKSLKQIAPTISPTPSLFVAQRPSSYS